MNTRWYAIGGAILASAIGVFALFLWLAQSHTALAVAAPADAPTITQVDPSSAPNDLDTPIIITGTGFTAGMSGSLVIMQPTVRLDGLALTDIGWVSSATLTATVPWGLDAGVYTLTVVNPDEQSGSLTNAFTVTQGIGVWTTGGPYGGQVQALAIHPAATYTLFAAATLGGLFRSQNGGETWELVSSEVGFGPSIAIAPPLPAPPHTIYVASGGREEEIHRSDDGGDTWLAVSVPDMDGHARVFAHPTISSTVYAGYSETGGLFKSEDRGQTWITITNGLTDTQVSALAFQPTDPLVMYVGTTNGNVFRSQDGGASWGFIGRPDNYVGEIAVNPFNPQEVWVCGSGAGIWGALWKYDSGVWTQISPGSGWGENIVYSLAFDQHVSGTMWIGTNEGGFKSTDGGISWTPFSGLSTWAVIALAVDPLDSQTVYQGYNGAGIHKTSDDGFTWQQINQGLAGVVPNALATVPGSPETVYALVDMVGLFKSTNGGNSWLQLSAMPKRTIVVDPITPTRVYADYAGGAWGNGVMISEDGGEIWRQVLIQPPSQYPTHTLEPDVLIAPPASPGHLILGVTFLDLSTHYNPIAGGFYTSDDFGETWSYVELGYEIGPVFDLAYDPENPAVIYAATSASRVLKSSDGGATWQPRNAGLEGLPAIEMIEVEPAPPYRVFAAYGGGLFVSLDDGGSWESRNAPPYGAYGIQKLFAAPASPPALYIATALGLYRSTDGAQSWQRAAGSLGYANVWSMTAGETEDRIIIYVGTASGSVSGGTVQAFASGETFVNGGVYRYTTRLLNQRVYLPLISK